LVGIVAGPVAIGIYRVRSLRQSILAPSIAAAPLPAHSHSMISEYRSVLIVQRKFFLCMTKNRLPETSEICVLDFKTRISTIRDLLGFSDYRHRSVDFFETHRVCDQRSPVEKYRQLQRSSVQTADATTAGTSTIGTPSPRATLGVRI